ncbi:MAG: ABC transporter permease subunit, partial [Desulfovibrio sp.]
MTVLSGKYGGWILNGLFMTLSVSALSIIFALILGTIVAVMRMSGFKPFQWLALAYTEFFRNTPLLVQIYFWYFGSDPILPRGLAKWLYSLNLRLPYGDINFEFAAGVIALTIYTSAFIAEEIRSGVFAIPKNQLEASRAVGLSFIGAMWYVILP